MPKVSLASDNYLLFHCPGCETNHGIPVDGSRGWTWNRDVEKPTVTPSIAVHLTLYGPDKLAFSKYDGPFPCEKAKGLCHSYVTDGRIQFLGDCTHALAGQTIDLPEYE